MTRSSQHYTTMWTLSFLVPALCVFAARAARGAGSTVAGPHALTDTAAWLQLLTEYAREVSAPRGAWSPQPFPADLPLPLGPLGELGGGRGGAATLPVLVLPLPLPVPATTSGCKSSQGRDQRPDRDRDDKEESVQHAHRRQHPSAARNETGPVRASTQDNREEYATQPQQEARSPLPRQPATRPTQRPAPAFNPFIIVSSQQLVEVFRTQASSAPHLPPALLPEKTPTQPPQFQQSPQSYRYQPPSPRPARDPPRPRFDRSLFIRGELTVPSADYTEPYAAWWDAESGAARVQFHGSATDTFRAPQSGGQVRRLEMRLDRSGGEAVWRCGAAESQPATASDWRHPALPNVDLFSFDGYVEEEGARLERWRHVVSGRAGEWGASRGEALTVRHELLVSRMPDQSATPRRYTVSVDSSVLGPECEGYEHRYEEVAPLRTAPHDLAPPPAEACDITEPLDALRPEHFARLEPLHEFTLPHRDPRYDAILDQFKTDFGRQYVDETEEAVRKALVVQHSRFVSSGNRQGAPFELGVNFLGDRLDAELDRLLGVVPGAERGAAERFPHAADTLDALAQALPDQFDWRTMGAVTPPQYQGSCSSCWAFAVAGAVEGALFVRTGRLVALSEQALVDCAHPFGGNGCGGTWPSHAFDYVQSRGLPARDLYTPYIEKVVECRDEKVPPVTRISAHVNVTRNSVPALKVAIQRHAPTVVIVDAKAKSFIFYKKGVLYDDRCGKSPSELNHAVLAVGWGQTEGEPHFVLKNSWSEAWGEGGFVRVQARPNTCGVLELPSYPRLERADVLDGRDDLANPDVSD